MKLFGSRLTGTALAVLVAACVQVYPPSEQSSPSKQTASNGAKKDNGPFKPYAEVLKDTEELAGYFTFHEKRDNTLFLELRPDQLDMEFGLVMHYSRGVGGTLGRMRRPTPPDPPRRGSATVAPRSRVSPRHAY